MTLAASSALTRARQGDGLHCLHAKRQALSEYLPQRVSTADMVNVPAMARCGSFALHPGGKR